MRLRVARKVFKAWSYRHRKGTHLRAVYRVSSPGTPPRAHPWPPGTRVRKLNVEAGDTIDMILGGTLGTIKNSHPKVRMTTEPKTAEYIYIVEWDGGLVTYVMAPQLELAPG